MFHGPYLWNSGLRTCGQGGATGWWFRIKQSLPCRSLGRCASRAGCRRDVDPLSDLRIGPADKGIFFCIDQMYVRDIGVHKSQELQIMRVESPCMDSKETWVDFYTVHEFLARRLSRKCMWESALAVRRKTMRQLIKGWFSYCRRGDVELNSPYPDWLPPWLV